MAAILLHQKSFRYPSPGQQYKKAKGQKREPPRKLSTTAVLRSDGGEWDESSKMSALEKLYVLSFSISSPITSQPNSNEGDRRAGEHSMGKAFR